MTSLTQGNMRVKDQMKESLKDLKEAGGYEVHDLTDVSIGNTTIGASSSTKEDGKSSVGKKQQSTGVIALFALLMVVVGGIAAASFLYIGITSAKHDEQEQFDRRAAEVVQELKSAWEDYQVAGLWIHESCRKDCTRQDFRELYEYLKSDGLEFQAAEFIPNITQEEREQVEEEDRQWYAKNYPDVVFHGFKGFEPDEESETGLSMQNRSEQPFYFPVRYVEPVESNAAAAGFDLYSSSARMATIEQALGTWEPALSNRLQLVQETDPSAYSVLFFHPGVSLQMVDPTSRPRDLSLMVIRIPALLERTSRNQLDPIAMYIYDKTVDPPQFLGAIRITAANPEDQTGDQNKTSTGTATSHQVEFLPEMELEEFLVSANKNSHVDIHRDQIMAASNAWEVVVIPVDDTYEANLGPVLFTGIIIAVAAGALSICLYWNMRKVVRMNQIIVRAEADHAIVSNLFPARIRAKMLEQEQQMVNQKEAGVLLKGDIVASDTLFGSAPIAELYPEATILFADMCGFTAWSSVREPSQVFILLETVYHSFDLIAKRRKVFKVETVGDCYVACAGLPNPRRDHALVMARFAWDCLQKVPQVTSALEPLLGPDTAELSIRVGLHSGQVTAGVLRGDKGRFQLFGDSMNTASRMESTGLAGKIQVSEATARLIEEAGKKSWLEPRTCKVQAKGLGSLQTFWLQIEAGSSGRRLLPKATASTSESSLPLNVTEHTKNVDSKTKRLVEWNVTSLERLLRQIVVRRLAGNGDRNRRRASSAPKTLAFGNSGSGVIDEVKEVIYLPELDADIVMKAEKINPQTIELLPEILPQLTEYVTRIAKLYHDNNTFHNFQHASHVSMSVTKLLSRIVNPKLVELQTHGDNLASDVHDHTYGITSDPLTQFACVFSALIHDVDHAGVSNAQLIKEEAELASKYNNKSVLEQNSLDIAWSILMEDRYNELRACIAETEKELVHFRSVLVNSVMATDIMDKELGSLRGARWAKAFSKKEEDVASEHDPEQSFEQRRKMVNRKATIVIEHLIQASDVAHTMQHWHVYKKWNERLFLELYAAYEAGRMESNPAEFWYKGEIGFFEYYIIPLTEKLKECGVFGVSSDEYKSYAVSNLREWKVRGNTLVAEYLAKYHTTREESAKETTTNHQEMAHEVAKEHAVTTSSSTETQRNQKRQDPTTVFVETACRDHQERDDEGMHFL